MNKIEIFEEFFGKTYYFKGQEIHHLSHGRIERDNGRIYSAYVQYSIGKQCTDLISRDECEQWLVAHAPTDEKKDKVPASQWFAQWLKDNAADWQISPAAKEIKCTKFGVSTSKDADALRIAVMATVYDNQLPYGEGEIKTAIANYIINAYQHAVASLAANIKYDASCVDAGERWLAAVYNYLQPKQSLDMFKTLMRHWAWQVKRKVLDLDVVNHIWLNFYGAAGLGKTTMARKICKPMEDFCSTTSISKLFDDTREIKRLTENFVLVFDELGLNCESEESGKLSADQKALIKSIITGEKLDTRTYGTQEQSKKKITFSCLSTANQHLYDVIYDDTTMRRFFEFECQGVRPQDFTDINKYLDNSVYFWRSVDEALPCGYWDIHSEIGQQITAAQQSYYPTKTTTKMWIDAVNVCAGAVKLEDSYKAYANWCRETGNRSKSQQNFATDIKHLLPQAVNGAGRIALAWTDQDAEDINQMNIYGALGSDMLHPNSMSMWL